MLHVQLHVHVYYHKAQRYTLYNLLLHIDYTVAEHSKAKKMEIANLEKTNSTQKLQLILL